VFVQYNFTGKKVVYTLNNFKVKFVQEKKIV